MRTHDFEYDERWRRWVCKVATCQVRVEERELSDAGVEAPQEALDMMSSVYADCSRTSSANWQPYE